MPSAGLTFVTTLLCLTASSLALPAAQSSYAADKAFIQKIQKTYEKNTVKQLGGSSTSYATCSKSTAGVRRSWDALSENDKIDYLNAVKCLYKIPSKLDKAEVPGAHNFVDDLVYAHINQTNVIHISGLLLPWHRQFIWTYEQTLRNECGYKGYLPYWDWAKYADDQASNPMFDSGPSAFGGNGQFIPHQGTNDTIPGLPQPFPVTRPAGTGSGCVTDGAFANHTVTLGPVAPANNGPDNTFGLKNNPRCLKRDFYQPLSSQQLNYTNVATLLKTPDIDAFRPYLDLNIHPAAHSFVGKDLYDLFTSPNDPVFFLLHSQIDRLWTIWQGQDYKTRGDALNGTVTFFNIPPSEDATVDTVMKMGVVAGGDMPVGDVMSATEGRFCYMYEGAV